jgi:glycosyltransferase involved in cell wall biosynthesis
MRILSVLTYYHPHWTGLTAFARRIAEGLVVRGHRVTVVAACLIVAVLCRLRRRPLVMMHYGDLILPAGLQNRIVERTVMLMMTTAGHLAERLTILSADYSAHSAFLRPFAAKLTTISPPVDLPCPQPAAVADWRRRLGLDGKRIVGFAGRFVEEKGFDYLLNAVPRIVAREPKVHLVYAGEHRVAYENFFGRCRSLIDRYRDRITFVGLLRDPQQLANFYAMCDVFALPSRTDCFAGVQVEAMLSGTPVVSSDIPGAREVVMKTGMGLLARPADPESLASAVCEVMCDRARFIRPRARIRDAFDPEHALAEYERLMRSVVEGT